jgi:hypothetical protein
MLLERCRAATSQAVGATADGPPSSCRGVRTSLQDEKAVAEVTEALESHSEKEEQQEQEQEQEQEQSMSTSMNMSTCMSMNRNRGAQEQCDVPDTDLSPGCASIHGVEQPLIICEPDVTDGSAGSRTASSGSDSSTTRASANASPSPCCSCSTVVGGQLVARL